MSSFVRLAGLSFLLSAACTVGTLDPGGGGPGSGSDPGSGSNPGSGDGTISGAITSDQTWTGKVTIGGNTTINAGVTVTVAAGTMIEGKTGATVNVQGTLDIQGTKDAVVTILPVQGASTWPGFVAAQGGTVNMAYVTGTNIATLVTCRAGATCGLDHVEFSSMGTAIVVEGTATITASRLSQMTNGGVSVQNGDLKIVDSYILTSQGDIIVQNGGNLDITYSEIGDAQGSYEHCDVHINSAAKLSITRSNLRNGVYGMMIGGTTNAIIQYDNFVKNGKGTDIEAIGTNSNADFQYDYWDQGAPTMAGGNFANPMGAMIADAGPRAANL